MEGRPYFDPAEWAGLPRQLVMPPYWQQRAPPAPDAGGTREAERGRQPEGPGESEESFSYYRHREPPWRESERQVGGGERPGYEVRAPRGRRRTRDLPRAEDGRERSKLEGGGGRPKEEDDDQLPLLDADPGTKLKPGKALPKSAQPSRVKAASAYGGEPRLRICPSNYTAMEIHGFFGLIDDGPCSSGRMLVVHVPSWIKGYFLDLRDGDRVHAAHVNGKVGGVLRVLAVGRHRYYSPGAKVSTCTICVPEEQWERFKME